MSMFKKTTAFLTAAGIALSCAACGYNTLNALTVDGIEVPAGIYIYNANSALNQALSKLKQENSELDTTDMKAVRALTLEGKDVETWIKDEATKSCTQFAVIENKFDELGLSISDEDKSNISMMKDYYWNSSKEMMEKNGISEASFEKIVTSGYKSDAIYQYYYAVGGQEGVTDEDVYNYYKDNNIRAEYISVSLKDGEGNLLKSDGKKEMMTMIEGYRDRVEDALAEGGVKAAQAEMAEVRKDYQAYVDSLTAEASGEETTEAETVEETAAETEATAAETETTAAEGETTKAEETKAETTEAETTVEEESGAVLNAPKTDESAAETAAEGEETTEDTTEKKSDEETTVGTTEKADSEEGTTEAATEAETEEETDEETAEDADTDDLAESAEDEDPYANESIISVIHEEDYDDPEQIYYNPTENVYKKLLSIEAKDYGKPYIVEEDESYYLVVRYDIEDRMVANDLWTESTKDSAVSSMHSKDFQDMVDGWVAAANVQRNEAAYKRFDPFKFDFT